jgi:hypothetical protein
MFDYFTPVTGAIGGSLIGLAAGLLLLLNGDILGASGIMRNVFAMPTKALSDPTNLWRVSLVTAFLIVSALMPKHFTADSRSINDKDVLIPSAFAYSIAGLLVGIGTTLGNGCTSVHGVCGLGRGSPRSLVGVLAFMATGVATSILVTSPKSPWADYFSILRTNVVAPTNPTLGYAIVAFWMLGLLSIPLRCRTIQAEDKAKVLGGVLAGALFAAGLCISGMVISSKLFCFLNMAGIQDGSWDPTLMTVLGSAIPVSFLSYQFVPNFSVLNKKGVMDHPAIASSFRVPTNRKIDSSLVVGEAIFGIGWGLGVMCPGPAMYHLAVGNTMVMFRWLPGFVVGSLLVEAFKTKQA